MKTGQRNNFNAEAVQHAFQRILGLGANSRGGSDIRYFQRVEIGSSKAKGV